MRTWTLVLLLSLLPVPAAAQTMTVQTPNERFVIVHVIPRTNSTVYGILDTATGAVEYRAVPIPVRQLSVSARSWDPRTGRDREIIGYDACSFPVYRDEDPSRVVYWVVERDPARDVIAARR
jgi:hypothetical protein